MSARAFSAIQDSRAVREAGVGNWALSMGLVAKAAMWMAAMRGAWEGRAGERVRGEAMACRVGDGILCAKSNLVESDLLEANYFLCMISNIT